MLHLGGIGVIHPDRFAHVLEGVGVAVAGNRTASDGLPPRVHDGLVPLEVVAHLVDDRSDSRSVTAEGSAVDPDLAGGADAAHPQKSAPVATTLHVLAPLAEVFGKNREGLEDGFERFFGPVSSHGGAELRFDRGFQRMFQRG